MTAVMAGTMMMQLNEDDESRMRQMLKLRDHERLPAVLVEMYHEIKMLCDRVEGGASSMPVWVLGVIAHESGAAHQTRRDLEQPVLVDRLPVDESREVGDLLIDGRTGFWGKIRSGTPVMYEPGPDAKTLRHAYFHHLSDQTGFLALRLATGKILKVAIEAVRLIEESPAVRPVEDPPTPQRVDTPPEMRDRAPKPVKLERKLTDLEKPWVVVKTDTVTEAVVEGRICCVRVCGIGAQEDTLLVERASGTRFIIPIGDADLPRTKEALVLAVDTEPPQPGLGSPSIAATYADDGVTEETNVDPTFKGQAVPHEETLGGDGGGSYDFDDGRDEDDQDDASVGTLDFDGHDTPTEDGVSEDKADSEGRQDGGIDAIRDQG
jgi:hypothetical protein